MKVDQIFYSVGVLFIISSIIYFTKEFIADLPDMIKLVLLIVAMIIAFITAEFFRGKDK
ncbi:hypothetical protein HN604_03975 [archaeon]|jgi:hypothetical protein|nr:hypothetical protein [archaeon]MBT6182865.1 hypothetical protein [archaeon]MBT6606732.1 hypothetical protein [archaeon]MBT7251290.1 hypothetical protein [archaeon]MBT7661208.1 hypothetical protein [archaeon]